LCGSGGIYGEPPEVISFDGDRDFVRIIYRFYVRSLVDAGRDTEAF
jgi:hypothetical protein